MVTPSSSQCLAYAWMALPAPRPPSCAVGVGQLWTGYVALGGVMTFEAFDGCVRQRWCQDQAQGELVVLALNEHLLDHGQRFPLAHHHLGASRTGAAGRLGERAGDGAGAQPGATG